MEQQTPPGRTCSACGSSACAFRSRRQIEADPEKDDPAQLETKHSCNKCEEEWKEKVPGVPQKAPPPSN
jgi:hypothetical protein